MMNKQMMKQQIWQKTLLATCIAAASTQAGAVTQRIIGGTDASSGAYPWMVSIQSGGQHFCGGSLIADQWVLTAAHCVEDQQASRVQVAVGEHDLNNNKDGAQNRQVSKIIIHPQRQRNGEDHDIALLKLDKAVSGKTVTQATAALTNGLASGTTLVVMGWGNQSTTGEKFPHTLNEVQVPLVSNATCKQNYAGRNEITDNMICAGFPQGGKDSCQGDSGGPLVYQQNGQWHQVGIVSFGEGCAQPNYPGVYARVANYNDWVAEQMKTGGTGNDNNNGGDDNNGGNNGGDDGWGDDTNWNDDDWGNWNDDDSGQDDWGNWDGNFEEPLVNEDLASLNLPEFFEVLSTNGKPKTKKLKIKNKTKTAQAITSINVDNPAFTLVNAAECTKTLQPKDKCKLQITYTPEQQESFTQANLDIELADGKILTMQLFGEDLSAYDFNDQDGMDFFANNDYWQFDDKNFSLNNGYLNQGDHAIMEAHIQGPGKLEFDFFLGDDAAKNGFIYKVDGKTVRHVKGGERAQQRHSTYLSAGQHRITWTYKKQADSNAEVKVGNVQFKASAAPNNSQAVTPTNNTANTSTAGGGGSADLLFLSGFMLLLGGLRKFFKGH